MSQNTIVWTDIPVADLDRSIRFYSAVLGAELKKDSAGSMEFGLLPHFQTNVAGCLVKVDDNKPSLQGPLVYLNVDGRLDDAIAKARDGGKVLKDKHSIGPHGFRAIIVDSEGNRVALHSQKA
jgi:uncharacterized protein